VVADRLVALAASTGSPQVRAIAALKLEELRSRLAQEGTAQAAAQRAHQRMLAADIGRFLEREYDPSRPTRPPQNPPGAPIGDIEPPWYPVIPPLEEM
jgi:hypothetical protein